MPMTTAQIVQPNNATADRRPFCHCQIAETTANKCAIAHHKPITWPQNPAAHKKTGPIDHVQSLVSVHQVQKEVQRQAQSHTTPAQVDHMQFPKCTICQCQSRKQRRAVVTSFVDQTPPSIGCQQESTIKGQFGVSRTPK